MIHLARGRLKTMAHPKNSKLKHMLPLTDEDGECEEADESQKCFDAGTSSPDYNRLINRSFIIYKLLF